LSGLGFPVENPSDTAIFPLFSAIQRFAKDLEARWSMKGLYMFSSSQAACGFEFQNSIREIILAARIRPTFDYAFSRHFCRKAQTEPHIQSPPTIFA
jgi:hypothetical protein